MVNLLSQLKLAMSLVDPKQTLGSTSRHFVERGFRGHTDLRRQGAVGRKPGQRHALTSTFCLGRLAR